MKHQPILSLAFLGLTLLCGASAANAQPNTLDTLIKNGSRYTPLENGCSEKTCTFFFSGAITDQTAISVKTFLETNKSSNLTVAFDSLGGDVRAALEVGRIIRKYGATTQLMSGVCASACVMAFVGGADRTTLAASPKFGIHTPYTADTISKTYENSDSYFKTISRLVKQYLEDMNIPSGLYDEMLRYPAESMHILTKDELSRYRVLGMDPAEQDRRDSNSARKYGVDKRTFLGRKQLTKIECDKYIVDQPTQDSIIKYITCRDRIMHGN